MPFCPRRRANNSPAGPAPTTITYVIIITADFYVSGLLTVKSLFLVAPILNVSHGYQWMSMESPELLNSSQVIVPFWDLKIQFVVHYLGNKCQLAKSHFSFRCY